MKRLCIVVLLVAGLVFAHDAAPVAVKAAPVPTEIAINGIWQGYDPSVFLGNFVVGAPITITVSILDATNHIVPDYAGTLRFYDMNQGSQNFGSPVGIPDITFTLANMGTQHVTFTYTKAFDFQQITFELRDTAGALTPEDIYFVEHNGPPATLTLVEQTQKPILAGDQMLMNRVFENDAYGNPIFMGSAKCTTDDRQGSCTVNGITLGTGFTIVTGGTAGVHTATVADVGVPSVTASFTYTVDAAGPARIRVLSPASMTLVTDADATQNLQVLVTDNFGNPAATSAAVSFTVTAADNGAVATFPGGTNTAIAISDASSIATAPRLHANGIAGHYVVTIQINGILGYQNVALENDLPVLTGLTVSGAPPMATIVAGQSFTVSITGNYSNGKSGSVSGLTYSASPSGVINVTQTGTVMGIGPGTATITITASGGVMATLPVTVTSTGAGGLSNPSPLPMTHAPAPTVEAKPLAQPGPHPASGSGLQPQAADVPAATPVPMPQPTRH